MNRKYWYQTFNYHYNILFYEMISKSLLFISLLVSNLNTILLEKLEKFEKRIIKRFSNPFKWKSLINYLMTLNFYSKYKVLIF